MGGRHGTTEHAAPGTMKFALWVLASCGIAALIGMVLLWPGDVDVSEITGEPGSEEVNGTITAIEEQPCPELPDDYEPPPGQTPPERCGLAEVQLETGDTVVTNLPGGGDAPVVDVGDDIVLLYLPDSMASEYSYHIIDHDRSTQLWILAAAFAGAVIAFGRWRGVTALIGLIITFAILLVFIIPAILDGKQPLLVAIVGAAAIMLTVLYLTHGFNTSTTIAVLGVLVSLVLTGVLSALAVDLAHLTGVADEDTSYLSMNFGVNMQGLLLAGILIGSLGVLDDVSVTQAATVTELARANPRYSPTRLYRSAIRVGRSHIASVVNTIILAYAGAALPLLILIAAANRPLSQVVTNQLIAEEIVRSAVGTIGLIAAVPITTALAAMTVRRFAEPAGGVAVEGGPVPPVPGGGRDGADPSDPHGFANPDRLSGSRGPEDNSEHCGSEDGGGAGTRSSARMEESARVGGRRPSGDAGEPGAVDDPDAPRSAADDARPSETGDSGIEGSPEEHPTSPSDATQSMVDGDDAMWRPRMEKPSRDRDGKPGRPRPAKDEWLGMYDE